MAPRPSLLPSLLIALVALAPLPITARDRVTVAEAAARALTGALEKEGFAFRAESWRKDLRPDMGKAVRVQLFKGNDYRFAIAVPADSGVRVTAAVLDFEGRPQGEIRAVEEGWGLVLSFKPRSTGIYAVAIRQNGGAAKTVECAMLTGYK